MATSRRYPIGCTLGLMLGSFAFQALAEPPAATTSNDTGLMTFPHVSVVNAPIAASEQKPAASEAVAAAAGMRAYINPDTGELSSEPTAAEAAQLSKAARTGIATARTGVTAAITEPSAQNPQIAYGPDNSIEISLGEESMVFQMARKDPSTGKLIQQCVTGEDNAAHALHSAPAQDHAKEESNHDR